VTLVSNLLPGRLDGPRRDLRRSLLVAKIWSVYDRDYRLVLAVSDEPGIFNFAKLPDEDVEPIECDFATLQAYDVKVEPDVLNILLRSQDLDEFLDQLSNKGFKVIEGRPQPRKLARL
jgi:hypothetical protein